MRAVAPDEKSELHGGGSRASFGWDPWPSAPPVASMRLRGAWFNNLPPNQVVNWMVKA